MGPCFVCGLSWCYDGSMRIPNWRPRLGVHRIYQGYMSYVMGGGPLFLLMDIGIYDVGIMLRTLSKSLHKIHVL